MNNIIMYTSSTWPHCVTAKEFLREKGYKYVEKNVSLDREAQKELMNMGIMGVPAFLIGDKTVVGLDKKRIEELIDYTVEDCSKCNQKLRVPKKAGKIKVNCPTCGEDTIFNT